MVTEDYTIYKALQQERSQQGASRRAISKAAFAEARDLAKAAGLTLVQHTDIHYSLHNTDGWLLNIYPGNRRLYHDRQRPKPPFLKVKPDWIIIDVVKAAIAASKNMDDFAKEIESKIVTNEEIQTRAYYLWEAAGRPSGDGQYFWHQAERELRG